MAVRTSINVGPKCVTVTSATSAPALRLHAASSMLTAGRRLLHRRRCHYKQRRQRGVVTALNARTRLRSAEHMFFQRRSSERRSSTTTSCRSAAVAGSAPFRPSDRRRACFLHASACLFPGSKLRSNLLHLVRGIAAGSWQPRQQPACSLVASACARGWLPGAAKGRRRRRAVAPRRDCSSRHGPKILIRKGSLSPLPRSCRRFLSLPWTLFFSAPLSGGFTDPRDDCGHRMPERVRR